MCFCIEQTDWINFSRGDNEASSVNTSLAENMVLHSQSNSTKTSIRCARLNNSQMPIMLWNNNKRKNSPTSVHYTGQNKALKLLLFMFAVLLDTRSGVQDYRMGRVVSQASSCIQVSCFTCKWLAVIKSEERYTQHWWANDELTDKVGSVMQEERKGDEDESSSSAATSCWIIWCLSLSL